jgi:hypothetical protein
MKTPRDALLEKHMATQPKLDALRRHFITSLPSLLSAPSRSVPALSVHSKGWAWRDFILEIRWHLVSLSGAWVLIALMWVSAGRSQAPRVMQAKTTSPRTVILALKANRRQVLEFGEAPALSTLAVPPPHPSTRRGSLESKRIYC